MTTKHVAATDLHEGGKGTSESKANTEVPSLAALLSTWVEHWKDVFRAKSTGTDVLSGVTVAAVALPLNLALGVASGVPPSAGIVAGVVGGFLAAFFGGSALQVTGPAAALSTLVLGIAASFGPTGVAAACVVVGAVLITLGVLRAGRFAHLVPASVLAGFTTGVGLRLLDQQIPEVLGFDLSVMDIAQMMHRPEWLHDVSWLAVVCGLFVALLVVSTRHLKRFPAAIVGVGVVTFVSAYLNWDLPRVGNVPDRLPDPVMPLVPDDKWLDLLTLAVPLGLLVGVESLLSARAVDRMAPTVRRHEPNLELFGQGVANVVVGFFAGMPVSGVVVRSGVNAQSGGRTRLAAMVHSLTLGAAVLYSSQYIARIPLPALAGLLCVIGLRLIELSELRHLLEKNKFEALAFLAACAGTVAGHLLLGLVVGIALSALGHLFHRLTKPQDSNFSRITVPRTSRDHDKGIRAVLPSHRAAARRPEWMDGLPAHHAWLRNINTAPLIAPTAFIHEQASVIGHVVLGDHVHVASGSSIRADEGAPFFLGDNTNVQDGVVIHALQNKWVRVGDEEWAVYVGRNVSIAHDALVHGPCYVGDDTFIGFKAVVHDSVVGSHCFIGIGAVVVGVEIPDGRFVPHGTIVSSQDAVDALPEAAEAQREFNEDVVHVNRGLAVAYQTADARIRRALFDVRHHSDNARPISHEADWERPTRTELSNRF